MSIPHACPVFASPLPHRAIFYGDVMVTNGGTPSTGRGRCDVVLQEMEDEYSGIYTDMTALIMQRIARGESPELTTTEQMEFKNRLDDARTKADRFAGCMLTLLAGRE